MSVEASQWSGWLGASVSCCPLALGEALKTYCMYSTWRKKEMRHAKQQRVRQKSSLAETCIYFRRIKVNFIKDCGLKLKNVTARTGERRKRHKSPAAN